MKYRITILLFLAVFICFSCGDSIDPGNSQLILDPDLHSLNSTCQGVGENYLNGIPNAKALTFQCDDKNCVQVRMGITGGITSIQCMWY